MRSCPVCGEHVGGGARYCPHCGAALSQHHAAQAQLSLPLTPWPTPALATVGGAAAPAAPNVGQPLTARQVAVAIGAILLSLIGIMLYAGRRGDNYAATSGNSLPVIGKIGEPLKIGDTMLGVAFTNTPEHLGHRSAQRGHFIAVGVVIGNRGNHDIQLNDASLRLANAGGGERYRPVMTAWGTPEELNAGVYHTRLALPPREAVTGLLVFDVPDNVTTPHLLVRDLTAQAETFTGAVDLTKQAER